MRKKIEFPKLTGRAQLCFIRKHRSNNITKYYFHRATLSKKVSGEMGGWLLKNINTVDKKTFEEYRTQGRGDNPQIVNLDAINAWQQFKDDAFKLRGNAIADIKKIKTFLVGFIIFVRDGDNVIGHVRKMTPTSLLDKKGFYSLFLDDSSFNVLKEEKGVRIDQWADVVFKIDGGVSEGIILNEYNFTPIFDMFDQQKKDAIKIMRTCPIMTGHPDLAEITTSIGEDRIIQRMLTNPAVKLYMNEVTYEDFKTVKTAKPDEFAFELDETQKQIIFPTGVRKAAIRGFISVISYKYAASLNGKHILEVTPAKFIN